MVSFHRSKQRLACLRLKGICTVQRNSERGITLYLLWPARMFPDLDRSAIHLFSYPASWYSECVELRYAEIVHRLRAADIEGRVIEIPYLFFYESACNQTAFTPIPFWRILDDRDVLDVIEPFRDTLEWFVKDDVVTILVPIE